jgi:arylsulfatase A-like enzyme
MSEHRNVILLSVDALRADHLGYHGYHRDTSPFLDSLAERVARFDTAISASSHTREAVPALLSGEYPEVFAAEGFTHATETVADRLSAAGYRTAGFHSNPYVSRAYGFDSGFDTFDDDLALGQNRLTALIQRALDKFVLNKGEYHARAETINRKSLDWLDGVDKPFFVWNHYMDPHGPYNPPEGYTYADRELSNSEAHDLYQKCIKRPDEVTEAERELLIDAYDGEIRYLDEQLSAMFDGLEERGVLEESLVVVTADHGDAFGEHGYYTHPRYLHESLIHVPLLVSMPGDEPRRFERPVSTLDIVPTVLDWTGTSHSLPGASLLSDGRVSVEGHSDVAFATAAGEDKHDGIRRFAARSSRWKAHLEQEIESGSLVETEVFDLETDPGEQNPVESPDGQAADLVERLQAHGRQRLTEASGGEVVEAGETDEEIEERLEALGYR